MLWCVLTENGLNLGDFSYDSTSWSRGVKISHALSQSEFRIFQSLYIDKPFTYGSHVGDDPPDSSSSGIPFEKIVQLVGAWGCEAAEWAETPDLWKSMPDSGRIPGSQAPDSPNNPFSPNEQAVISSQLRIIAETVKKAYELTAEQSAEIDKKFEEAEKASRRMGRKDWGLLFGGAVFSLILSDAITPGIAGHILTMVEHGIGYLFAGGTPFVRGILSAGQD
jgi:hypothetical protein